MTTPTIYLNGTSSERLLESLSNAKHVLQLARESLLDTAPNGRDYYPQGPQAIKAAIHEHLLRLQKIDEVGDELQAMMLAICQAGE